MFPEQTADTPVVFAVMLVYFILRHSSGSSNPCPPPWMLKNYLSTRGLLSDFSPLQTQSASLSPLEWEIAVKQTFLRWHIHQRQSQKSRPAKMTLIDPEADLQSNPLWVILARIFLNTKHQYLMGNPSKLQIKNEWLPAKVLVPVSCSAHAGKLW